MAEAGRKRVVVLDFEGPKGDKFHEDLVRLIKKTHTVVPTDKWNGAAEQLAAAAVSDKNVKKVAHKLKIDAIVEGRIEKRRDEFIIRLKLRAGRSGELIGDSIDTKAEGPRIDGRAQRDLKDELVGAIDNVESNHASGEADDDEPLAKKTKKVEADDEAEDKPAAKKAKKVEADDEDRLTAKKSKKAEADDEDRPAKSGFSKHFDDERGGDKVDRKGKKVVAKAEDEDKPPPRKPAKADKAEDEDKLPPRKPAAVKAEDEDKPAPKKPAVVVKADKAEDEDKLPPKKPAVAKAAKAEDGKRAKAKKVASRDDDDASTEVDASERSTPLDAATRVSPGERAVDATLGMSITMRRMTFKIDPLLRATPPGYKGIPVAGAMVDATVYPLAVFHKRHDIYKDIGLEILYDRVFKLSSRDPQTMMVYPTEEARYLVAPTIRHAFGSSAIAPTVYGSIGYMGQRFNILGMVDIPDVKYAIVTPGAGAKLPLLTPKATLGVDGRIYAIRDTGAIQAPNQYGGAVVFGYEASASLEYRFMPNLFARAAVRYEKISFDFAGTGFQSTSRDGNAMSQDVTAGTDTYFGGSVIVGVAY
ncbi:MAG TPA: hypothetical protein VK601_16675 [Kofleriaceae bacterium]|nr:hypothetical protein [Kofleriaceae bacterium]